MALNTDCTIDHVKDYLLSKGIPETTAENFRANEICGQALFNLTQTDLKELVPVVGIRTKVRELLKHDKSECESKSPKVMNAEASCSSEGSWKESLRSAFKNFRRPTNSSASAGYKRKATSELQSTPKRRGCLEETDVISSEEYDEIIEQLKVEWKKGKKKRNKSTIKVCMEKTVVLRQKWIMEDSPPISQVLSKFPPLRESKELRKEFRRIVDKENLKSLKDEWPEWMSKVVQFARLDACSRPFISKMLCDLDAATSYECIEDYKDAIWLEILIRMLYPRGSTKGGLIIEHFKTRDVDIEKEIETSQSEPYIVVLG